MRILAPYNKNLDIKEIKRAGADELYVGFYDDKWSEKFGEYSYINRMSDFKSGANAVSIEGLNELTDQIKSVGMRVYITLNAAEYSLTQADMLEEYLRVIKDSASDGIIVSSIAMARIALNYGVNAIASTMCGIFNVDILDQYIKAGIKRVIIPRELTISEIAVFCEQYPEIEFEAFIMRNGCIFADSNCLGVHGREYGALCRSFMNGPFRVDTMETSFESRQEYDWNLKALSIIPNGEACAMCALYSLIKAGVSVGKIVGRNDNPDSVIRDVQLVKKNISIACSAKTEEEYLEKMIFPKNQYKICIKGLSCYYPEIRFPG